MTNEEVRAACDQIADQAGRIAAEYDMTLRSDDDMHRDEFGVRLTFRTNTVKRWYCAVRLDDRTVTDTSGAMNGLIDCEIRHALERCRARSWLPEDIQVLELGEVCRAHRHEVDAYGCTPRIEKIDTTAQWLMCSSGGLAHQFPPRWAEWHRGQYLIKSIQL